MVTLLGLRLTRPDPDELRLLLEAPGTEPSGEGGHRSSEDGDRLLIDRAALPSDAGDGLLIDHSAVPSGYRRMTWSTALDGGRDGGAVFADATAALFHWRVHMGAGLVVMADGPARLGTVVALSAPLPVGWVDAVCRVVAVVDEPRRHGFVYRALEVHPEQGEESFIVHRRDDGSTIFTIVAVSRPRHPLGRLCPPVARRLQNAATQRYLAAMRATVGGHER